MPKLQKKLTLFGLTMIAVGSCIGSGIFVTPAQVAGAVPNAALILLVWALGGVIALTGALTFSELGGMFPKSGGVYVYLREAYGNLMGFLYGWAILLVITTGALAGLCVAFAEYLKIFFPEMTENTKVAVAAFTLVGLTAFNMFGVHHSQRMANLFTGLKLLAIAAIIVAGFVFYRPENVQLNFSLHQNIPGNLATAMLTGLIGVLFSVGGWHHASYLSGEAIDAKKTVPRAMFLGVVIVMVTYLLVNLAYMFLLPIEQIAQTPRVAGDAISTLVPWGGKAVAVAIAISIFGTISIYTMTAPRIYYAMAKDGVFFKQLAYIHPRWHTPVVAMGVQVVWALAILLFFSGEFNKIITFVTSMDIAFMALAGAALFIFRKKRKKTERPVKVWGYPFVPFVFVAISVAFAVNTLLEKPGQTVPGLLLLSLGAGVFYLFKRN
ncbi:MAG TPA: amino acid permease [Bacteroidetes bacterium]|nr:amino acid permease [Bacteroidota bacterium]